LSESNSTEGLAHVVGAHYLCVSAVKFGGVLSSIATYFKKEPRDLSIHPLLGY